MPEPTRRDGEHVFDARRAVECEVMRRLAGKLGKAQLQELRQTVEAEARATAALGQAAAPLAPGDRVLRDLRLRWCLGRAALDALRPGLRPCQLLSVFRTLLFLPANSAVFVSAHGDLGLVEMVALRPC